jgi:hypothetical protein
MLTYAKLRSAIGLKRRGIIHFVDTDGKVNDRVGSVSMHPNHISFSIDEGPDIDIDPVARTGATSPAVRAPGFTHVTRSHKALRARQDSPEDQSESDAGDLVPLTEPAGQARTGNRPAGARAPPAEHAPPAQEEEATQEQEAQMQRLVVAVQEVADRRRQRDADEAGRAATTGDGDFIRSLRSVLTGPDAKLNNTELLMRITQALTLNSTLSPQTDARKTTEVTKRAWEEADFKINSGTTDIGTTYFLIPAMKLPKKDRTITVADGSALKKVNEEAKALTGKWMQHDNQTTDRPKYAEACQVMTFLAGIIQIGADAADQEFMLSLTSVAGYMFEVKAEAVDNTLNPNAAPDANTANRLATDLLNALGLSRDVKTVAHFADTIVNAFAVRHCLAAVGVVQPVHALEFHKARMKIVESVVRLGLKVTDRDVSQIRSIPPELRDLIKAEATKEKEKEKEKEAEKAKTQTAAATAALLANPLAQAVTIVANQRGGRGGFGGYRGGKHARGGGGNQPRGGNPNQQPAVKQESDSRKQKPYSDYLETYTDDERAQHVTNALLDLANDSGAGNLPRQCREYTQVQRLLEAHPIFVATASLTRGDRATTCLKKMGIAVQIQPELALNPVWKGLTRALERRKAVEELSRKQAPPASVADMRKLIGQATTPIQRAFLLTWLSAGRLGERWRMALAFTSDVVEISFPHGQKSDLFARRHIKKWIWAAQGDQQFWESALAASYDDCYSHMKRVTPHLTGHSIRRGAIQLLCEKGITVEQASWLSGHTPATQASNADPPGIRPYLRKDDGEQERRRRTCISMSVLLRAALDPSSSPVALVTTH